AFTYGSKHRSRVSAYDCHVPSTNWKMPHAVEVGFSENGLNPDSTRAIARIIALRSIGGGALRRAATTPRPPQPRSSGRARPQRFHCAGSGGKSAVTRPACVRSWSRPSETVSGKPRTGGGAGAVGLRLAAPALPAANATGSRTTTEARLSQVVAGDVGMHG